MTTQNEIITLPETTTFIMDGGLETTLMLALQSPELEILGITTVAGNESLERATADSLRMLEIANRTDIPVHVGADMPLVHAKSDFAVESYGRWYSDEVVEPPGGFARIEAQDEPAVSWIVDTVMERPGEVTIVAIGPLTNIAQAILDNKPEDAETLMKDHLSNLKKMSAYYNNQRRTIEYLSDDSMWQQMRMEDYGWEYISHNR